LCDDSDFGKRILPEALDCNHLRDHGAEPIQMDISSENCLIVCQNKGFVNTGILNLSEEEVFFSHGQQTKKKRQHGDHGFLFMKRFSGDSPDRFSEDGLRDGILPVTRPRLSRHEAQSL
jgi:hypothetical protein